MTSAAPDPSQHETSDSARTHVQAGSLHESQSPGERTRAEASPPRAFHPRDFSVEAKIALTAGVDLWRLYGDLERGLPQIKMSDGPHGLRTQEGEGDELSMNDSLDATCFPPAVGIASTWSPETAAYVGAAIAAEAHALGVHVVLGPGLNIKRSPLCGRNFEYFSEDPHLAGELATAFVVALQEHGIGASPKHFALNNQETDRLRVSVEVDDRALHEIYLRAFRTVVQRAKPWTLMCSYNAFRGTLVSQNRYLLTEVLREQWGFDGVVVSDWGAVVDRPAAVAAGLDLQMPCDDAAAATLRAAIAHGRVDPADLDRASGAVLQLIERTTRSRKDSPDGSESDRMRELQPTHHQVALEAARQAIVLLHNDGALPLETTARIAVIGEFARTPRYQGAGSSHVNPTQLSTALEAIEDLVGHEVPFAPGFALPDAPLASAAPETTEKQLREDAVRIAREADVTVAFVGLGENVESEGWDREHIDLPTDQIALLNELHALDTTLVVVLSNGSAVAIPPAVRECSAVLEGWLLGQAGGQATAEVLFGKVNPSGKLAETIPLRLADVPSYLHFPGENQQVRYGEGIFVGYRGFDATVTAVAYPFGHGLSYTTFDYSSLHLAPTEQGIEVTVTVTNTGERAGREVVQSYVSVPESALQRPPRELKGFADVTLQPGESAHVQMLLRFDDLQYWHVECARWALEGGDYLVEVGASSRDLRLSSTITVVGDEPTGRITATSRPLDVKRVLGNDHPLVRELYGHLRDVDPAELKRIEQIPLDRLGQFARMDPAQFHGIVLDLQKEANQAHHTELRN